MKRLHFRQGDVLLMHCDELPPNAVPESNKERIVLAWGEATGHAHVISTAQALAFQSDAGRFIKVEKATALRHEEHDPIPLEEGIYKVIRQKEYVPSAPASYVDD